MERYTIHCTEEQTRKALELGAPIRFEMEHPLNFETLEKSPYPDIKVGKDGEPILITPTAEQMIGWLEEQGVSCYLYKKPDCLFYAIVRVGGVKEQMIWAKYYFSRKEATLAAIDAALDYLIKNKK